MQADLWNGTGELFSAELSAGCQTSRTNTKARKVITENFYMDDLLVGADSEKKLQKSREAIHERLQSA